MTKVQPKSNAPTAEIQTNTAATNEKARVTTCPGHSKLFHRYLTNKRAEKKAEAEIQELRSEANIKAADFKVVNKKDIKGQESGIFRGLNSIFKCAVFLNYMHVDNCDDCPYIGAQKV